MVQGLCKDCEIDAAGRIYVGLFPVSGPPCATGPSLRPQRMVYAAFAGRRTRIPVCFVATAIVFRLASRRLCG
jgi:hypothetical protein